MHEDLNDLYDDLLTSLKERYHLVEVHQRDSDDYRYVAQLSADIPYKDSIRRIEQGVIEWCSGNFCLIEGYGHGPTMDEAWKDLMSKIIRSIASLN